MRTINVTIAAQSDDSQNLMIFFVLYPFAFLSIHFISLILFELKKLLFQRISQVFFVMKGKRFFSTILSNLWTEQGI